MNILVLYGGESAERAVSLRSGARIADALREQGHCVCLSDYRNNALTLAQQKAAIGADAVFLALHGGNGEDGGIQSELESLGVRHYTGSGPHAAALAMRKDLSRDLAAASGVPVAKAVVWQAHTERPELPYPFVQKPLSGGSSVGFCVVHHEGEGRDFEPTEPFLCEAWLGGAEYTVGVAFGRALPVVEIRPRGGTYDYAHKYTKGASEEICPAPISAEKTALLQQSAETLFCAFGLRDLARFDFKDDMNGTSHFLEVNTLPGMTRESLFPLAAACDGMSFSALCERLALAAAQRKK